MASENIYCNFQWIMCYSVAFKTHVLQVYKYHWKKTLAPTNLPSVEIYPCSWKIQHIII